MRDSEIEQRVLHELRLTSCAGLKDLCVFSSNGVVVLRGTVPKRENSRAAQAAATNAMGVIAVINELNSTSSARKGRKRRAAKSIQNLFNSPYDNAAPPVPALLEINQRTSESTLTT